MVETDETERLRADVRAAYATFDAGGLANLGQGLRLLSDVGKLVERLQKTEDELREERKATAEKARQKILKEGRERG